MFLTWNNSVCLSLHILCAHPVQQGLLALSKAWHADGLAPTHTRVEHRVVFCEIIWFLLEMKSPKRRWIRIALL